jgi:beta-phosphoglucomutase
MAFQGAIFDVDGVLVDSPHELAWRESFRMLMETEWLDIRDQTSYSPERFTPAVYQQVMAGMPRMAGARAAMEHFGVPDVNARVERYAAGKQEHVIKLIEQGRGGRNTARAAGGGLPPGPWRAGGRDGDPLVEPADRSVEGVR